MTRSTDFDATVKHGTRAVQPDLVIYARRASDNAAGPPKIGLIIGRSVGSAVHRHQLARRLRHVSRDLVQGLEPDEHVVIRALPSSRGSGSDRLTKQLRAGLGRIRARGSGR
jgi:ribonuclease P protein component